MEILHVEGIDDTLYEALAVRAALNRRSISQEVVMIIQNSLSWPGASPQQATEALLELAGTWADERDAESIVDELRGARNSRSDIARYRQ